MLSDTDAETVQVKMQPVLSDMPPRIKQMIAERSDPKSRYSLRKVSTHFRAAVDESPYFFNWVYMRTAINSVQMRIANTEFTYKKHGENGCVIKRRGTTDKIIEGEDFMQRAIDDLGIILKNPRILVKTLKIAGVKKGAEHLLAKLDTFHHQLNVRKLEIFGDWDQNQILHALRHMKPGILMNLDLTFLNQPRIDLIVETDHWPHLKIVSGRNAQGIPVAKFLHLEELWLFEKYELTEEIVEEIVQEVLQRRSNMVHYKFYGSRNSRLVTKWQNAVSQYQPSRKRMRIPGTEYYLQIKAHSRGVTFKKIGGPEGLEDSSDDDDSDVLSDSESTDEDDT